jgi:hypothetical protein
VQLTYGESGLLTFLDDLFEPVKDEDKTEGFNYYFLLKQIFAKLEMYPEEIQGEPVFIDYDCDRE